MGVWLRNKTQNPLPLPYPYRGILAAGGRVPVNLTEAQALTALALVLGDRQNYISVEQNAPPPYNDRVAGDAAEGLLIGAIESPVSLSNVEFVENLAGFPAPSAGQITLAANTVYKVNGAVDYSPNQLVFSAGSILQGFTGPSHDSLTTSFAGPAAAFIDTGGESFAIKDLAISVPNTAFIDVQGSPSEMKLSNLRVSCKDIGTLSGVLINVVDVVFDDFDSGCLFTAGGKDMLLERMGFHQTASPTAGSACIDLGANVWTNYIRLSGCDFAPGTDGFALKGATANANLVPGVGEIGLGEAVSCVFAGTGTNLSGITVNDLRWTFRSLLGQANSAVLGAYEMDTPAATVLTQNVPTKIAGTTTPIVLARFIADGNNKIVFAGVTPMPLRVDVTGVGVKASGGGKTLYEYRVYKKGVQLGTTGSLVDTDNRGESFSLSAIDPEATATDYYEVFVENLESGDNITVTELQAVVTALPAGQ